ncbi:Na+/H+ antiporter subunit E [Tateyamaria sp. ANG-S1]|uniref:Na+/H+ antiporter subunit E n=1 Tax=Tateyamaria sp. ANG-S1 TaxID=1577905 RepID=UPI00068CF562|nr:Na+/H+ antiporter subunit E [Tateyamaria sp. ANG-S1]
MVRVDEKARSSRQKPDLLPVIVQDRSSLPVKVGDTHPSTIARTALAAAVLAVLWWILNPGDRLSWIIGVPTILLGTGTVLLLPPARSQHISVAGSLRFVAYFIVQTVLGAVDVARRAFHPFWVQQPAFLIWETDLPEGPPRWMFANTVTLLPGTLTADIDGPRLTINLLDRDLTPDLPTLEARVRDLFAL